jgi:SAM-dependent methyltransferase
LGASARGKHLLLIEPDLVGGYIEERGREVLTVKTVNKFGFGTAKNYYNRLKGLAVPVQPDAEADLKRAWLKRHRIGEWDARWDAPEHRDVRYFDDYDRHIRCWVPLYDKMIGDCAAFVQQEVVRIYRARGRAVNLLELGYGTGGLTVNVARWVVNLHEPFLVLEGHPAGVKQMKPVAWYYGIDRAPQMKRLAEIALDENLGDRYQAAIAIRLFTEEFRAIANRGNKPKFDVIFGSLILHFILGNSPEDVVGDLFRNLNDEWLEEGGSLVFADVVFSEDHNRKTQQLTHWRRSMVGSGMEEELVDRFLAENPDMTSALSFEALHGGASAAGLGGAHERYAVGSEATPFEIVVFRKGGP